MHCIGLVHLDPPGSKNMAESQQDSPGTWDALRLHLDNPWREGRPDSKAPGPRPASGLDGDTKTGAREW